jgi:biopolymer transport protein ExbD
MRKRSWESDPDSLDEPLINLTPLIDVVFVVLIAFMLIAPILDVDTVDLATSATEKRKDAMPLEQSPLAIQVRADNSIWIQGKRVNTQELEQILRRHKKLHPQRIPQLIHDKNATFGTYQSVKNILERCGFEQMEVILKPG